MGFFCHVLLARVPPRCVSLCRSPEMIFHGHPWLLKVVRPGSPLNEEPRPTLLYFDKWHPALFTLMWLVYKEWESKCKFSTRWIFTFCTFASFLPSVDIICVFRKTAWPNDFLQLEHVLALTPLWVRVRIYREKSWANNIWQWTQVYAVLYRCGLQCASPDFLLDRMTSHILN